MTCLTAQVSTEQQFEFWRKLAEVTLTRLILFNKRRTEEPAQMLVERFKHRPMNRSTNEELVKSLKPMEKHLMNTMDMVEVLGKKNRKVPVLMTESMLAAVNALVSNREAVGIPGENPFVFAVGQNGRLRGCATVKRTVESCTEELECPDLIKSTKLRKCMATVSQVFNLSNSQLEELARHMGHELSVHRHYYRLQEDVVELAKVSKLLITVEKGKAHKFSGMCLDDIHLDDLDVEETANADTESVTNTVQVLDTESSFSGKESSNIESATKTISNNTVSDMDTIDTVDTVPDQNNGPKMRKRKNPSYAESGYRSEDEPVQRKFCRGISEDEQSSEDEYVIKSKDVSSSSSEEDEAATCTSRQSKNKKKEKMTRRTVWTEEEKAFLEKHLLQSVRNSRKPPTKRDCLLALAKSTGILEKREWKAIKYQTWAIYQQEQEQEQEIRKRKQVVNKLLKVK